MASRFRLLRWAEFELDEAIAYYEQERPDLGFEFFERYETAAHQALSFPELPSPITERRFALPVGRVLFVQFPYDLVVARDESDMVVVAIAHHKRRPFYWRKRLAKL